MRSNFDRALPLVLKHEGGYVDHPRDPGGATNLGVTIGTLSGWLGRKATKAEVRALTRESVAPSTGRITGTPSRPTACRRGSTTASSTPR